jgi:hypothetical protein
MVDMRDRVGASADGGSHKSTRKCGASEGHAGVAGSGFGRSVGRVGALAVALGIGAAVVALPGLAAADTTGSEGSTGSSSSRGGAASAGSANKASRPSSRSARGSANPGSGNVPGAAAARAVPVLAAGAGAGAAVPDSGDGVAARRAGPSQRSARIVDVQGDRSGSPGAIAVQTPPVAQTPASPAQAVGTRAAGRSFLVGGSQLVPGGAAPAVAASVSALPGVQAAPVVAAPAQAAASAAVDVVTNPLVQKLDSALTTMFRGLLNWVSTLPVNPLTDFVDGALWMIRKQLLNQGVSVRAIQTSNSSALVSGEIGVIDPDGDDWAIEVVQGPTNGAVELGTVYQQNGIGSLDYSYVPGPGYSGADQFVVKISNPNPAGFHILDRIFDRDPARYLTVKVGDDAEPDKTFLDDVETALDHTVFMTGVGVNVTVLKEGMLFPRYTAVVTLAEDVANRSLAWMDSRGHTGSVAVEELFGQKWSALKAIAEKNAIKPLLMVGIEHDGVEKVALVEVDAVTKNTAGVYQVSGQLMADVAAHEGRVDAWDFLGFDLKEAYGKLLSGFSECGSGQICASMSGVGVLGATTFSAASAVEAGYRDYRLPSPGSPDSAAVQLSPGQLGWGTLETSITNGGASSLDSPVTGNGSPGSQVTQLTTMIPYDGGGSFLSATNLATGQGSTPTNNGINLYAATSPAGSDPTWAEPLKILEASAASGWDSPVMAMHTYFPVQVDSTGALVPVQVSASSPVTGRPTATLSLAVPADVSPWDFIGQPISGEGIPEGASITGIVDLGGDGDDPTFLIGLNQGGIDSSGGVIDASGAWLNPDGTGGAGSADYSQGIVADGATFSDGGFDGDGYAYSWEAVAAGKPLTAEGEFETPVVGSGGSAYVYNPTGSAWTFTGDSGISGNGSGFTAGNPDAPGGSQVAFLQMKGEFSQVITGLEEGQEYTLSFAAAQRANYPDQSFNVTLGGQTLFSNLSPTSTDYQWYSTTFTAQTGGSQTLTFTGLEPTGVDETVFLDEVSLRPTAVSQPPVLVGNGVTFGLGAVQAGLSSSQPNVVRGKGQTMPLSSAQIAAQARTFGLSTAEVVNVLNLAGAAVNGAQTDVQITLTYTDGSTEVWTQSFSDWCNPDPNLYPREQLLSTQPYRNYEDGTSQALENNIYSYSYEIPQGKTLKYVGIEDNSNVVLVGMEMSVRASVIESGGIDADGQAISAQPWLGADGTPVSSSGLSQGYALDGTTLSDLGFDGDGYAYSWNAIMPAGESITVDAGFETPDVGSGGSAYVYNPTGSAWTFTGSSGISGNGSGFTAGNPNAPSGSQVAFLQMKGDFSQVIAGLEEGQDYILSFDAAQRANYPDQSFNVTLGDQTLFSNLSPTSTSYQSYPRTFTAQAGGSQTLTFTGLEPTGVDETVFLDQVSIAPIATSIVAGGVVYDLASPAAGGSTPNVVRFGGQTIALSQDQIAAQAATGAGGAADTVNVLNLIGAGVNGAQTDQQITLTYKDGSTEVWTQSFSDWCNPGDLFAGEDIVSEQSYRLDSAGQPTGPMNYVYGYRHVIAEGKTLASVTVPNNTNIALLGLQMSTVQQFAGVSVAPGTTVTLPGLPTETKSAVFTLRNGEVWYWNGQTTAAQSQLIQLGTLPLVNDSTGYPNMIVDTVNQKGAPTFAVGLNNGHVWRWDGSIDNEGNVSGGFTDLGSPGGDNSDGSVAVVSMIESPGGVTVGTWNGYVSRYQDGQWTTIGGPGGGINALLPYDNVQLVGAIAGTPVVACTSTSDCSDPGGVVMTPFYLDRLLSNAAYLKPVISGCEGAYDSATGGGCSGYLLTVQEVSGTLKAGQTLYGGAMVTEGTRIVSQLADGTGALCDVACEAGGAGVYVVDRYQLVGPGTPMSASDGSGAIVGSHTGYVGGVGAARPVGALASDGSWGSDDYPLPVNAIVPWRDGFVVGLGYYQYCPGACGVGNVYWGGGVASWRPTLDAGFDYTGRYNNGWTMLQGPSGIVNGSPSQFTNADSSALNWVNPVSSMTPIGDGVMVGLSSPNGSQSGGMVGIYMPYDTYQGFAFGYEPGSSGPALQSPAATPLSGWENGRDGSTGNASFLQIANPGSAPWTSEYGYTPDANGTVSQMFATSQFVTNPGCATSTTGANCDMIPSYTVVVALTNNAIYSWNSSTEQWTQLQPPNPQGYPPPLTGPTPDGGGYQGDVALQDAWEWGTAFGATAPTSFSPTQGLCASSSVCAPAGLPDGSTLTGDPVFGVNEQFGADTPTALGAYCGLDCGSYGDYIPVWSYRELGGPTGVVSATACSSKDSSGNCDGTGFEAEIQFDVNVLTYGYLFAPNGVFAKFLPGKYSVGVLTAVQAGPEVNLSYPAGLSCSDSGACLEVTKDFPLFDKVWETEVGSFSLGMGVNLDLTADFPDITPDCSSGTQCKFKLADAYYTTGLLFSWNPYVKDGSGKMSMSFAHFYDYYLADLTGNVTPTVTPWLQASYGLFTPPSTPLIGKWTVFDLGAKYSNPISMPITIVDGGGSGGSSLSAELTSEGIITTFAQFIPDVTGILSWSHDFTVYESTIADLTVNL